MFKKTLQATHPDMMRGADAQALSDRYLVTDLFAPAAVSLTYAHVERFVIGGAMPSGGRLLLPAPATGAPFLERRELGIVNVGGTGRVSVDGQSFELDNCDGLYVPMASAEVTFESATDSQPARFNLVSSPAHARYEAVKISPPWSIHM